MLERKRGRKDKDVEREHRRERNGKKWERERNPSPKVSLQNNWFSYFCIS